MSTDRPTSRAWGCLSSLLAVLLGAFVHRAGLYVWTEWKHQQGRQEWLEQSACPPELAHHPPAICLAMHHYELTVGVPFHCEKDDTQCREGWKTRP